jgi:hypothetical protein
MAKPAAMAAMAFVSIPAITAPERNGMHASKMLFILIPPKYILS